ncbi:hypothetical protein EJB05_39050 [Eragrostis curvula]|uniref:Uncharacterized protein n=1 Tax=Eragrostis curvula TaxID=38414 RepID=A0A5J9TVY0_9POAL|nr:hypothetical protein EJB05_39050 [Eragrostis curvula]
MADQAPPSYLQAFAGNLPQQDLAQFNAQVRAGQIAKEVEKKAEFLRSVAQRNARRMASKDQKENDERYVSANDVKGNVSAGGIVGDEDGVIATISYLI